MNEISSNWIIELLCFLQSWTVFSCSCDQTKVKSPLKILVTNVKVHWNCCKDKESTGTVNDKRKESTEGLVHSVTCPVLSNPDHLEPFVSNWFWLVRMNDFDSGSVSGAVLSISWRLSHLSISLFSTSIC